MNAYSIINCHASFSAMSYFFLGVCVHIFLYDNLNTFSVKVYISGLFFLLLKNTCNDFV